MRALISAIVVLGLDATAQTWTQMPDFPGTARDDAAAFAIEDKVYVGTGMEVGWGLTNDWYRFDGSTFQWSSIAPLPATPRQYCSAFVLPYPDDMFGYLFGGLDANGPLNELWRFDPATDTWSQLASLPGEPRYAAAAFNGGYVATGIFADGSATSELWKYDHATDTWQQLATLPGTARHRACGSNWTGYMVIGGADEDFNALADCWSYNALTDAWSACASLPEGRYGAMCGLAAYDFMLIGGATDASTIVETALSYNTTSWLPLGDPHPGGTRRGGIMIQAGSGTPGEWYTYLGLGLSDDLERHNDWYVISGAFSIAEPHMNRLTLHPNPGTSHFTLTGLPPGPMRVTIIDPQGRQVLSVDEVIAHTIDASRWNSGIYVVTVIDRTGQTCRARWIKL